MKFPVCIWLSYILDVVVFVRADVVNRMSNTHTCHKKNQHTIARNRNMDTPIAGYSG
jgi:hypothetical protein